jgi:hypothetical protein
MKYDYISRYIELFDARNEKYFLAGNTILRNYNGMLMPFGPVSQEYIFTEEEIKGAFIKLGGYLLRYTNGFSSKNDERTEWYAVICKEWINMDTMKSKQRSEINRGLQNCSVKLIDASYMADHGFEILNEANKGYGITTSINEDQFKEDVRLHQPFSDIVHYWGVFSGDKLIAFAKNYILDKIEVNYTQIKYHPEYLKLYPSVALIYTMNEYYLNQQKFSYVSDGFRSIYHDSAIQEYLIKKFNFNKEYTALHIKYRWPFGYAVNLSYPFKNKLDKLSGKLKAIYEQERIARLNKDQTN